jgi:hypothetical protein
MNSESFIKAIKIAVKNGTAKDVVDNIKNPLGRSPEPEIVKLSAWYNRLSNEDKLNIDNLLEQAVNYTIFGFLCVLDGVRAIEGKGEKGSLELYYVKGNDRILLNDSNEEFLHDIYNAE